MSLTHDQQGLIRLDEDECWRFLSRYSIGRVAIVHFMTPLVFPVNYVVDGHSVVFRTAPGTKLAMATLERPAGFEVDDAHTELETGGSVMATGHLELVTDLAAREHVESLGLRTWAIGARDHFIRMTPTHISGRRIPVHPLHDRVTPPPDSV
jgi:nitroimidazol reductase NimA-like FMN-containing flavoprotein (pyridoxamine 5'-phosphate oxidase superfamily)